ncbi:MAG: multiheme c-type cytochrome, partial [Candidatus Thorarchaeota archaeon]|nr:multiheme c-type cytochrome [Candidatus Thorarchaeota archaeon]
MVYYVDSPTINKRMVAGYYLFIALVGFAVLMGPTGSGIPITVIDSTERDHELAYPGYGTHMDPTSCDNPSCHANEYGNWSVSEHGTSVTIVNSTHYGIGGTNVSIVQFNSTCSQCHTSGWENSTGTPTYEALNINCFVCHNSSGYVDYAGDVCATCHRPIFNQPNQYPDWSNSGHAQSLIDLRASGHASSSCMHCMSSEGFIYQQNPDMIGSQVDLGFNPDGTFNTVSCPACHSVHANWTTLGPHSIRAV